MTRFLLSVAALFLSLFMCSAHAVADELDPEIPVADGAEELGDRQNTSTPVDLETESSPETIIILGQPRETAYVVAIPGSREHLLDRVQDSVPQAFITDSRRGRYIQAGAFSSRSDAEALSCQLRHQGFDARVVYFRVR